MWIITACSALAAVVAALYTWRTAKVLEQEVLSVRLNTCFQILEDARLNYGWNPGHFSIAKRKIAGHILYGDKEALFVKSDDNGLPEEGGTLVLARLVKALLSREKGGQPTRKTKKSLDELQA